MVRGMSNHQYIIVLSAKTQINYTKIIQPTQLSQA